MTQACVVAHMQRRAEATKAAGSTTHCGADGSLGIGIALELLLPSVVSEAVLAIVVGQLKHCLVLLWPIGCRHRASPGAVLAIAARSKICSLCILPLHREVAKLDSRQVQPAAGLRAPSCAAVLVEAGVLDVRSHKHT